MIYADQIEVYSNEFDTFSGLALEYASRIVPVSEFDMLFAEDVKDPVAEHKNVSNDENNQKSSGLLSKAFTALKNLFIRVKEAVGDFFRKMKMSSEERDAYEKFKEACKNDPKLANKKISVKDYYNLINEAKRLRSEIDKSIAGNGSNYDEIKSKVGKLLEGAGKESMAIVAANTLLTWARSNKDMATTLNKVINEEGVFLKQMESVLGKKEASKFSKDLASLTKVLSLRKLKVQLCYKECEWGEAIEHTIKELGHSVASIGPLTIRTDENGKKKLGFSNGTMRRQVNKAENVGKIVKGAKRAAVKGVAKGTANEVRDTLDRANTANKGSVGDVVSGVLDYVTGKKKKDD